MLSPLLRALAFGVRSVPAPRLRRPFVRLAAGWDAPPTPFSFYSRQTGLHWSTRGLPDILTRHMLFEGAYQQEVLVAIEGILRPGDTFLDCGGHHGLMAIVAARAVGPQGRVISFEPNPASRRLFEEGCALNGVANVLVEPYALGDEIRTTKFYLQSGRVSWNSSLFAEFASQSGRDAIEEIDVELTTLDAYLANGPAPTMIKIDAEGSEFLILRGAREVLRHYRPVLSMELNPESAHAANTTVAEVKAFLESLGYRLVVLEPSRGGSFDFHRRAPFDVDRHCVERLANVLCLPGRN